MKKALSIVLALAMAASMAACGGATSSSSAAASTPASSSASGATGSVYYLNFKPEQADSGSRWANSTPKKPVCRSTLSPLLPALTSLP